MLLPKGSRLIFYASGFKNKNQKKSNLLAVDFFIDDFF